MVFYLTFDDTNRVFLDTSPCWGTIDTIDADTEYDGGEVVRSAWQVAREKVEEHRYFREYGHGYFRKASDGKSMRIRPHNG